jgi:hypothetical protein
MFDYILCCQWFYISLLILGRFLQFAGSDTQSVGLLGQEINPMQGLYLHTGQHKRRKNVHKQPCLELDSNPRYQRLSGQMGETARSL